MDFYWQPTSIKASQSITAPSSYTGLMPVTLAGLTPFLITYVVLIDDLLVSVLLRHILALAPVLAHKSLFL